MNPIDYVVNNNISAFSAWFDDICDGRVTVGEKFNWLGLSEILSAHSIQLGDPSWGRLAIRLYYYISRVSPKGECDLLELSAIKVRCFFIEKLGISRNDDLLDIDYIFDWFFSFNDYSLEWAERVSRNWVEMLENSEISIEDIKKLRSIKNRLNAILRLFQLGYFDNYPKIQEWIAIRQRLP